MRKTISVRHQKIDEYAGRLDSPQRDRLMHAIDEGALMAVFRINALTVTLENIGWPTGVDSASRVEVEPAKPEFFFVYVNGRQHYVLSANVDSAVHQALRDAGWDLVWDSARSKFAGAKYAADNYGAFVPTTVAGVEPELVAA